MSAPTPTSPLERPRLRWPLEIQMQAHQGQQVVVIRCPQGLTDTPLVLIPEVAPLLSLFQGELTIDEITARFADKGATREVVLELAKLLDAHLFLETDSFKNHSEALRTAFADSQIREAALAGICYPNSAVALRHELGRYLEQKGTPTDLSPQALCCLVAPHIDYQRGNPTYGAAFSALSEAQFDTLIVIGTSHQYSPHLFHLTSKDFNSPLGPVCCNKSFVQRLAQRYGPLRSYADEFLHRREHSLELQVPFLALQMPAVKIVPILVGSFHQFSQKDILPSQSEPYECFVESLTETIRNAEKNGERVGFLCGVDMAHVGAHFGDPGHLTPDSMEEIRQRDARYLECILKADHESLLGHIAEDGDKRRICGFPTMYTVLDTLHRLNKRLSGHLFEYRQAIDYPSDCAVTFAAVGLYESGLNENG